MEASLSVGMARVSVRISSETVSITDDDSVTVGFNQTQFTVTEDDPEAVSVCVHLTGELERNISLAIESEAGSANSQDFSAVSEEMVFTPGAARSQCLSVHVPADMTVEATESFSLRLSSQDSAVLISQGVSRVFIIDDDQVRVGFKERTVTVSEGSHVIPVCVDFVGRTQGDIEVVLESQQSSAQGTFKLLFIGLY